MLEVHDIHAAYGPVKVLNGVTLSVDAGEILCLLGRNGAGKTTTLKSIMGLLPLSSGRVVMQGETLSDMPAHKNIEIGLMAGGHGRETREWVLELFPRLRERMKQMAGTLSGGEQQMLATARALCLRPKVLLLDEPTEGLQPSMIALIRDVIVKMRDEGFAIILVEQRVDAILKIADRAVFLENGKTVHAATGAEMNAEPDILKQYLGV